MSWTLDNEYILSGSEDMNIRIWKTHAAKALGNVIVINYLKRFQIDIKMLQIIEIN